ncbi:MAG: DUF1292 domain-containing protein [Bacilli bacterium]|nr:DUF1292 domain-containing protein [Bacilli bacterium]
MNNKIMFFVINEEGVREDARILAKYKLSNGNNYITYTYDEVNDNNMIKIYSTGIVVDNGNYSYKEISTDDEWTEIKNVMKSIARDPNEPIDEKYKCDLKFEGEEVSVRKPKKLLVSKNFADTLASKYKDADSEAVLSNTIPNINVQQAVTSPVEDILNNDIPTEKEDILNKTIEIPTFEELQARNKNIENIMKSTKVEPVVQEVSVPPIEPKIKEVKPELNQKTYKEQFKEEVEPLLMGVYEKQMKHIEELEEELSKTKYDLFEKQKEALSLKKEKEEIEEQSNVLKQELQGAQEKMNGILTVLQGDNND